MNLFEVMRGKEALYGHNAANRCVQPKVLEGQGLFGVTADLLSPPAARALTCVHIRLFDEE